MKKKLKRVYLVIYSETKCIFGCFRKKKRAENYANINMGVSYINLIVIRIGVI